MKLASRIFFGVLTLYVGFIFTQFLLFQILHDGYSLYNIIIFLGFSFVYLLIFTIFFEKINNNRIFRFVLIVITVFDLNYLILTFFLGTFSFDPLGPVNYFDLILLVKSLNLTDGILIEMNNYLKVPAILNAVFMTALGGTLIWTSKKAEVKEEIPTNE